MQIDASETGQLQIFLSRIGAALDDFVRFEHPDTLLQAPAWRARLDIPVPQSGIGIDGVTEELIEVVIPNGSSIPRPGFSSYVTTGGTTAAAIASAAANTASPQRYGLTAFNLLEEVSLKWLASLCGLGSMQGVYSSGGSTANLLALGAARQQAFEQTGHDAAADGVDRRVGVYATTQTHHTIQRSAGVLGIGRRAVRSIHCDAAGRMDVDHLRRVVAADRQAGVLPMAIVANAGTTNTGAIDPLRAIADVARRHPDLELLLEPTLSICCFRHVSAGVNDLDRLNRHLHRRLIRENANMPSTTQINGKLALRPCFIGARANMAHADALLDDVLRIGAELVRELE